MLDYNESINRLIAKVSAIHKAEKDTSHRTSEARSYRDLADTLDETAALLDQGRYCYLEEMFNQPLDDYVDFDGKVNRGPFREVRYKGIYWALRDLAEFARRTAKEVPSSRKRFAAPFAARAFLHILYDAGKPMPTLHDYSDATKALQELCAKAGVFLSSERIRGLMSDALNDFDPLYFPFGFLDDVLVFV